MSLDLASALEAEILELKKDNARLEKDIKTLRETIAKYQDARVERGDPHLVEVNLTPPSQNVKESKGYRFDGAWT